MHHIITVKLNGCLWNSAQWSWTQYRRMMIVTHCHALCGGGVFAYFTQVWQSAEWHYHSKQGNGCNLISANKQLPRNHRGSVFAFFFFFFSPSCSFSLVSFYTLCIFIRIDICTNRRTQNISPVSSYCIIQSYIQVYRWPAGYSAPGPYVKPI